MKSNFLTTLKLHTLILMAILQINPAFAHEGEAISGGFLAGFSHPFFGLDHMMAMIAVGIWGGILGRPLIFVLPTIFPMMMAGGGVLAMAGMTLPYTELGIALSLLVMGGLIAAEKSLPSWAAMLIVASFAIFHGFAHGQELPLTAEPAAYSIGFVVATGLLHLAGIGIGWAGLQTPSPSLVSRVCGSSILMVGVYFIAVQTLT